MYALVEDGSISKLITNPKAMVIGDVRYPSKIFQLWSQSELNAIGIYEVITDSSNKKDEKWYINTNESYAFADNQVTRSWGTATPKAHADSLWTQADSDDGDLPDDKEVGDVKVEGLKTQLIRAVKVVKSRFFLIKSVNDNQSVFIIFWHLFKIVYFLPRNFFK